MRTLISWLAMSSVVIMALGGSASAQDKKAKSLQLKDLPAAVQKTVQDNLKGGELKRISKDNEDGIQQYQVESVLNGQTRDYSVDTKGKLLLVEEATTIDAIPAPAKATILKKVGGGTLRVVETYVKTGQPMMYEAGYTDKAGKRHEVLVKADGAETKE